MAGQKYDNVDRVEVNGTSVDIQLPAAHFVDFEEHDSTFVGDPTKVVIFFLSEHESEARVKASAEALKNVEIKEAMEAKEAAKAKTDPDLKEKWKRSDIKHGYFVCNLGCEGVEVWKLTMAGQALQKPLGEVVIAPYMKYLNKGAKKNKKALGGSLACDGSRVEVNGALVDLTSPACSFLFDNGGGANVVVLLDDGTAPATPAAAPAPAPAA